MAARCVGAWLSPQSGLSCRLAPVAPPLAALVAACLCVVLLFVPEAVAPLSMPPSDTAPAGTQVPETDSVLATTELQELLEQHGVDLRSLEPSAFDPILPMASSSSSSSSSGVNAVAGEASAAAAAASGRGSHQANGSSSSGSSGEAGTVPASSGSGGYLEHVLREAAVQLFGRQLPAGPLQMRVGRNAGALCSRCCCLP